MFVFSECGQFLSVSGQFEDRKRAIRIEKTREKEGLTIANLLAVNVWLNKWKEGHAQDFREVDLVFEKEGVYYLVETKRDRKYTSGYRQLSHIMECFHSDFEKNKVISNDFIPVLVTTSDKVDRIETTWVQPDFSAFLAEE